MEQTETLSQLGELWRYSNSDQGPLITDVQVAGQGRYGSTLREAGAADATACARHLPKKVANISP